MILAYPVKNTIFVAFDDMIKKGNFTIKDKDKNILKTIFFENSDFEKIEMKTDLSEVYLEILADDKKIVKKIYLQKSIQ